MRLVAICIVLAACAPKPPPLLFEVASSERAELTAQRAARASINLEAIDKASFRIELGGRTITPNITSIKVAQGTLLHGTFGKTGSLAIARIGNSVAGVVRDGGVGFEIVPFKGGHRIVPQSWKPPVRPRHDPDAPPDPPPTPSPPSPPPTPTPDGAVTEISVFFAYTAATQKELGEEGIWALAYVSLLTLDVACALDQIRVHFVIAGLHETKDSEYKPNDSDERLAAHPLYLHLVNKTRFSDAHDARKKERADILVLIADIDPEAGMGHGAKVAKFHNAVAVVDYKKALWNLTIPHEVGHVIGARHEVDDVEPYTFGHAYSGSNGRTIVSNVCAHPEDCPLYPVWSSPKKKPLIDQVFGDEGELNNAQVIRVRAPEVSTFGEQL
jgi:hypothetical protein